MVPALYQRRPRRGARAVERALYGLVAAGTVLAASRGARAAGPLPSLDWEAPAGCPDAAEVAHRVEVLLAGRADTVVEAQVRVTRSTSGYRSVVRVRTERGQGERVLDTASCAAAGEASALVIAMSAAPGVRFPAGRVDASPPPPPAAAPTTPAVSPAPVPSAPVASAPVASAPAPSATAPAIASAPSAGGAALATPAEPPKASDPVAPSAPSAPDRPAPPASPAVEDGAARRPRRFGLGVGATADTASLPQPAIGPTVTVSARPLEVLSVDLSGSYWPTQTALLTSTIGGHFDLIDASLRGCYERRIRVTLGACAGFFVDWLRGSGFGTSLPPAQSQQTSLYGGPLVAGSARFALTDWLGARVLAEADVPLRRQAFVVLGLDGSVHRPAAATARLALGLEATF